MSDTPDIRVQPAILEKDIQSIKDRIEQLRGIVSEVQLDVMDGEFVPNDTVNDPAAMAELDWGDIKIFPHLMINNPMLYLKQWDLPQVQGLMFHYEAASNAQACVDLIHKMEKEAIVVINPHTSTFDIKDLLPNIEGVMVMGVEPGFAAQAFNSDVLQKISYLRELDANMPIYVDGGVNDSTKDAIMEAGANIMCANSYIFKAGDVAEAVENLRTRTSKN